MLHIQQMPKIARTPALRRVLDLGMAATYFIVAAMTRSDATPVVNGNIISVLKV